MFRLHINTLIGQIEDAIDAHKRHDVFDLHILTPRNHIFLAQLLEPSLVELCRHRLLRELVVFENQLLQVVLVCSASLLIKHVNVA